MMSTGTGYSYTGIPSCNPCFSRVVQATLEDPRRPGETARFRGMRDAKTMQQRSGKAASKPRSSQAKKRSEPAEPAGEDAAGSAPSQETQRKKQRKEVVFGAQFMLFRVLCVAALVSGAYALPGVWTFTAGTSAEEAVKVLAKAGAVVEAVRLVWRRAGSDGRNGTDFKSHEPDSRTHRYHRERGFRLPDQDEVDQDARAAATHQRLREEPSAQISSGQHSSEEATRCHFLTENSVGLASPFLAHHGFHP